MVIEYQGPEIYPLQVEQSIDVDIVEKKKPLKQPDPSTQQRKITSNKNQNTLVAESSQFSLCLIVDLRTLLGFRKLSLCGLLAFVVCCALDLSSLLKSSNNILVLPADLVAQSANSAVFSAGLQSQHSQSLRNDNPLDFVVWCWDTLENLKSLHGGGTTGSLVRNHSADGLVEDSGWGTEMERTSSGWVVSGHLSEVGMVLQLRTEELPGDVQVLTSYNDDLLAVEQLLCNSAG